MKLAQRVIQITAQTPSHHGNAQQEQASWETPKVKFGLNKKPPAKSCTTWPSWRFLVWSMVFVGSWKQKFHFPQVPVEPY